MKNLLSVLFLLVFAQVLMGQKLYEAVEARDYDKVKDLLEKGEKVNKHSKNGLFPLWRAAADNDTAMVRLLLKHGAKVDLLTKGKDPITALIYPVQEGFLDIVKMLVEHGADVNSAGPGKQPPVRVAARNGRLKVLKYLIEKGANFEDKTANDGATPLEGAASKGHLDIVKFLVEKGANVNHQDNDKDTPIGEAAVNGHFEVVKYLLEHGADPTIKNKDGYDAAYRARIGGQSKIADFLEEYVKNNAKKD